MYLISPDRYAIAAQEDRCAPRTRLTIPVRLRLSGAGAIAALKVPHLARDMARPSSSTAEETLVCGQPEREPKPEPESCDARASIERRHPTRACSGSM